MSRMSERFLWSVAVAGFAAIAAVFIQGYAREKHCHDMLAAGYASCEGTKADGSPSNG